jgi:hypothetical protein
MPSHYQILLDGTPAEDALHDALTALEVEESLDLPGAVQLGLPVDRTAAGDLSHVAVGRFGPLAGVAVVATAAAGAECIFDGVVLAHQLRLQTGTTGSSVQVWGQDASWLMNLEEKVREWVDMTDADVAAAIFGEYGITPAPENAADESPMHTEAGHSLMQRAPDIQFLRHLARRTGKLCRVICRAAPDERIGYFARPKLDGEPAAVLRCNDPVAPNVSALDLYWDVSRPSRVEARQALLNDPDEDGASGAAAASGLPLLDARGLADFAGRPMTIRLTAPVDEAGELAQRARAVLGEAGWFVHVEVEADVARLGAVLRAGALVQLDSIGALHSGTYLVWSVRHTITRETHRMKLVLSRNAVGLAPASGGGLAGLLGGL